MWGGHKVARKGQRVVDLPPFKCSGKTLLPDNFLKETDFCYRYQLQIFLRLELLSVLVDKDDTESDVQQEVTEIT